METVNCDLCGHGEFEFVAQNTDFVHQSTKEVFKVVKCKKCDFHFTNPRPTKTEISNYYTDTYSFHQRPNAIKVFLETMLVWMANNLFFIIFCNFIPYLNKRLLYRIKPQIPDPVLIMFHKSGNLKFLDIGCGAGSHAHFWGHKGSILSYKKRGIDVEGLEISPNARDVLKNKGVVVYADLKDVSTEKRYDCIRLNWSLEHVHHPSSYFFFIKSHLNPNGICFINVPNNDGLLYKIYPDCLELPIHLNHFTLKTLEQYAKKHHLKVVGAQSFSYPATFFANALIYPALANFKKMSLIEAYYLNRSLNKINDLSGNDLLVTLST